MCECVAGYTGNYCQTGTSCYINCKEIDLCVMAICPGEIMHFGSRKQMLMFFVKIYSIICSICFHIVCIQLCLEWVLMLVQVFLVWMVACAAYKVAIATFAHVLPHGRVQDVRRVCAFVITIWYCYWIVKHVVAYNVLNIEKCSFEQWTLID